ncbi:hypothetical protein SKDZ_15G2960 [Saccharomyces kudriavzevii ZP591]|nr:hypothetical protein SKDZ_15G2960 [Saccharomyces kudriavzevii ZP591]
MFNLILWPLFLLTSVAIPLQLTLEVIFLTSSVNFSKASAAKTASSLGQSPVVITIYKSLLKYWSFYEFVHFIYLYTPIDAFLNFLPFTSLLMLFGSICLTRELIYDFISFMESQGKLTGFLNKITEPNFNSYLLLSSIYNVWFAEDTNDKFLFGKLTQILISVTKKYEFPRTYYLSRASDFLQNLILTKLRPFVTDQPQSDRNKYQSQNGSPESSKSETDDQKTSQQSSSFEQNYTSAEFPNDYDFMEDILEETTELD